MDIFCEIESNNLANIGQLSFRGSIKFQFSFFNPQPRPTVIDYSLYLYVGCLGAHDDA